MRRSLLRNDEGQAFVETAIFMPFMLLALLAIIFFTRLGVLSERSESAVRYGDLVSFRNGGAYTTSAIGYLLNEAVYGNSSSQLLDLCLAPMPGSTPNANPTGVNGAVRAALYQTQVASATATAAPSPQAFFRPDAISQPNCSPGSINLNGQSASAQTSGMYGAGNLPVNVDTFSITASVAVNNLISPIFAGGGTCTLSSGAMCTTTTANMAFVNVAAPTTLLTCVQGLSVVLSIMNPLAAGKTPACT
jgi:hypothetical protein